MKITIDDKLDVPIYQQIFNGIIEKIAEGFLNEEEKAPSIREIAKNSHVNPNTVTRAYQELINYNIIYVKRGIGNFIKKGAKKICRDLMIKNIKQNIKQQIEKLQILGFDENDINNFLNNIRRKK